MNYQTVIPDLKRHSSSSFVSIQPKLCNISIFGMAFKQTVHVNKPYMNYETRIYWHALAG